MALAVDARAETAPPRTFDQAYQRFGQSRGALEEALKNLAKAKCLDKTAVNAIGQAEQAIPAIKSWMGAYVLIALTPKFVPLPSGDEPAISAQDLKGKIAWAQFMVGRLQFLANLLRRTEPCEGVTLPPPPKEEPASTPTPGCPANEHELRLDYAKVITKIGDLKTAQKGEEEMVDETNRKLAEVKDPTEKRELELQLAAAEAEIERIKRDLWPLLARELELREKIERICDEKEGKVDRCVIGEWRSETVIIAGRAGSGGDGIVMTIETDGTLKMDYDKMTPITGSARETNHWRGTASGQINTSDGTASVKTVKESALTNKFTPPNGPGEIRPIRGLGPAALGGGQGNQSYECGDTTLTFQNLVHRFTFKRVP